jgi:hypothetical protein
MAKRKGHPSMFRDKADGVWINGRITKAGARAFDRARRRAAGLYEQVHGHEPSGVSDADTIEFLARGPEATRLSLEKQRE